MRTVVGYHRYDTAAGLVLLKEIWAAQSRLTNYFASQQKLISKVRHGAKVTKRYDTATTPYRRALAHDSVTARDKAILTQTYHHDQSRCRATPDPSPEQRVADPGHQQGRRPADDRPVSAYFARIRG